MNTPIVTVASRLAGQGYLQGVFIDNVLVGWGPERSSNDFFHELVDDAAFGREIVTTLHDLNAGSTDRSYRFGDGTPW